MVSLICGIQKKGTDELNYITEAESQMQTTNLRLWRDNGERGINWGIEVDIYILLKINR